MSTRAWKPAGEVVAVSGAEFQRDILFAFDGGDPAITIAVLDGPTDRMHDCFVGARLAPLTTAASLRCHDGYATAQGTHIASLLFGQPCSSVEGVAPLCRGLIVPIFGDDGLGCTHVELAQALTASLDAGADVILVSGGVFPQRRRPEPELIAVVAECNARDVLIVTGGGRDGCGSLLRLAGAVNVLSVGAVDPRGRLQGGGDSSLREVGLVAPGAAIIGAALQGRVGQRSGANSAAALIAGIAASLLGAQGRSGQALDSGAVIAAMLKSATPRMAPGHAECQRAWWGRDNVRAAAAHLGGAAEHWADPFASPLLESWYLTYAKTLRAGRAASRPGAG
ncbi:S8 family serine peptidase [Rhodopseudomonas sp. B29]|uniref:S8 family serine peptidase n=1 Tax=Rhodopseudomonas sp. B29 TaxID=95607 RepID=UPI001FCC6ABC|nr:S8 family serine peptidase [Rhodopseudomonas sp. B29]